MQDAYIVLGATGRLGTALSEMLVATGRATVLVGRRLEALEKLTPNAPAVTRIRCDLTSSGRQAVLDATEVNGDRLVVFDTVLDRRSSRAMGVSIAAATRITEELVTRAAARGQHTLLVSANSVAALAQWPFGSTYSRAKQRQAERYSQLKSSVVVYLPMLFDAAEPSAPAWWDRVLAPYFQFATEACSFNTAASILVATSSLARLHACRSVFVLTRRRRLAEIRGIAEPSLPSRVVAAACAPVVGVIGKSLLRSSAAWQRRAAYAIRYVSPAALRFRDHHQIAMALAPPLTEPPVCILGLPFRSHPPSELDVQSREWGSIERRETGTDTWFCDTRSES